jgi:hypothetical protein
MQNYPPPQKKNNYRFLGYFLANFTPHVFDFNEQAELIVRIDQYSKSIQEMLGWSPRKSNYYRLRLINSYQDLYLIPYIDIYTIAEQIIISHLFYFKGAQAPQFFSFLRQCRKIISILKVLQ